MKRSIMAVSVLGMLCGCGQQAVDEPLQQVAVLTTAQVQDTVASLPETVEPAEGFNTSITVQQLMQSLINHNAQKLWKAVSYVATANGVEETMPVSDADWEELLHSAVSLAEAGNALLVPGRPVAGPEYDAQRPAFQFSAAEIQARRVDGAENWDFIARGMQDLVLETLAAVQRRDIFALTDTGATINEACEACHASFWYRP